MGPAGMDLSRTVNWLIDLVPILLECESSHITSLPAAVAKARKAMSQEGLDFGLLRYLNPGTRSVLAGWPRAEIQFAHVGPMAIEQAYMGFPGFAPESVGSSIEPRNRRPDLFYCESAVVERVLRMRFVYGKRVYDRKTVEDLAHGWAQAIHALTA
jgi:non-ribosomal peptide synthase protein (TIGR01720 family)